MKNALLDKRIWITGASRGIGLELAKICLADGAMVLMSASTAESFSKLDGLKAEYGDKCKFFAIDLSKPEKINHAYINILDLFGVPDIIVNNAGIAVFKPLQETSMEEFNKINAINYLAPFEIFKAAMPGMIEKKAGTFINVLSVAATNSFSNCSVYGASKAALLQLSNSLREEVRHSGIKIVNVVPGGTSTEIWDRESLEKMGDRMITPTNLAQAIRNVIITTQISGLTIEDVVIKPEKGNL